MADTEDNSGANLPGADTDNDHPRKLVIGDLATSRVLFALALFGVMLPINSVVKDHKNFGFVYFDSYEIFYEGPHHVYAISFFYAMEVLLASAVYVYAFDFVFKSPVFQKVGTILYAFALLTPPVYLWFYVVNLLNQVIPVITGPVYYIIVIFSIVINLIALSVLLVSVSQISKRLREWVP